MGYFDYCVGLTMTMANRAVVRRAAPQTGVEAHATRMDLARSIQEVTEEILFRMARQVRKKKPPTKSVPGRRVPLNCVANAAFFARVCSTGSGFNRQRRMPAAHSAQRCLCGTSCLENRAARTKKDFQQGSYLGPSFSNEEIRRYLTAQGIPFLELGDEEIPERIADLIAAEKVIGWFKVAWNSAASAGARSILGDARSPRMQEVMN